MRPIVKIPLRYGVIAGVLAVMLLIGLYFLGRHPFLFPLFFDFRIFLFAVFIFFTLKELRDNFYQGILYFWQGLAASFIFVASFAVVAAAGIGVFTWLHPEFLQSYITLSTAQLKGVEQEVVEKLGKDFYERNLQMLPSTNAFDLVTLYFWQSFMIGLFISIILSVILRRQPKI